MKDVRRVLVSPHAMRRYATRVQRESISDHHRFTKAEHDRYHAQIFAALERAEPLPPQLCLLFAKIGNATGSHKALHRAFAEMTSTETGVMPFGEYYYDGEACFVIEDGTLRTVIVPDDAQYRTMDDWFARHKPRVSESQGAEEPAAPATPVPGSSSEPKVRFIQLPERVRRGVPSKHKNRAHTTRVIFLPKQFRSFDRLMGWMEKKIPEPDQALLYVAPALYTAVGYAVKQGRFSSTMRLMRASFEEVPAIQTMNRKHQMGSLEIRMERYVRAAVVEKMDALVFLSGPASFVNIVTALKATLDVKDGDEVLRLPQQPTILTLTYDETESVLRWERTIAGKRKDVTDASMENVI